MEHGFSSSPAGFAAQEVPWKPGPAGRAFGRLLISASAVFCYPFVAVFQRWDQLGEANSPLWVLLGYLGLTVAFVSVGRGVSSGRDKLIWNGTGLFFGMCLWLLTLFAIFD